MFNFRGRVYLGNSCVQGSLNGTQFWDVKQCKSTVMSRDLSLILHFCVGVIELVLYSLR